MLGKILNFTVYYPLNRTHANIIILKIEIYLLGKRKVKYTMSMSETETATITLAIARAKALTGDAQKKFINELVGKIVQTCPDSYEDIKKEISIIHALKETKATAPTAPTNAIVHLPLDGKWNTIKKTIKEGIRSRFPSLSAEEVEKKVDELYKKYYEHKKATDKKLSLEELFASTVAKPIVVEPDDDDKSSTTTSTSTSTSTDLTIVVAQPEIVPVIRKRYAPLSRKFKDDNWKIYFKDLTQAKCPCCNIKIITISDYHSGHIKARTNGGEDSHDNVIPICSSCNQAMGSTHMADYMLKYKRNLAAVIHSLRA